MISEKNAQGARFSLWCMHASKLKSLKKGYRPLNYLLALQKLPLCGLVVFIDINTNCIYLQKEAGISKHY